MKFVRMAVHPSFLSKMKITAAKHNKSMINLTKEMADDEDCLININRWKYQDKKNKFKFEL